ncbi:hypothetical protein GW17_00002195 [Ensete ventricosum]|nr:hypothetical protein GW17_00002195 [Ensete ventricosum]
MTPPQPEPPQPPINQGDSREHSVLVQLGPAAQDPPETRSKAPSIISEKSATPYLRVEPTQQELDTLSSDSIDSLRAQLRRVNKRLDEVQKEVTKSKEEAGESSKRGSPFAPEIQDKPIPTSFRLLALESYDGSSDPTEHVATFRAQMTLYDSSDALEGTSSDVIDVIVSGPTARGNNSSTRKAYVRAAVEKKPRCRLDPEISFQPEGEEYSNHDDAMVITIRIANARVKRIMIDTRSVVDILYFETFQKLGLTDQDLIPLTSTLTGFTGDSISPLGTTTLPVTIGKKPCAKMLMVIFMMVDLPSTYNATID